MNKTWMRLLATLIALILAAPAAYALDDETAPEAGTDTAAAPALVVDVIPAAGEVPVGSSMKFTVRVLNVSGEDKDIRRLDWNYDSVSLKAKFNGKEFELGHYANQDPGKHPFSRKRDFDTTTLPAGRSVKFNVEFPAVAVGDYEFTAVYQSGLEEEAGFESVNVAKVKVVESQGSNAVVARMEIQYGAPDDRKTGTLVFELFAGDALNTVTHQVQLMQKGFFNDLSIHRILPDQVIQGGDPRGDGSGGPDYQIKAELNDNKHELGALSMARSTPLDSAGCQFFVCSTEVEGWDAPNPDRGRYTVWGKAIEGADLLPMLTAIEIEENSQVYKDKVRDIRKKYAAQPEQERARNSKRDLDALAATKDRPTQKVTILSFTTELRKLDLKPADAGTEEDKGGEGEGEGN